MNNHTVNSNIINSETSQEEKNLFDFSINKSVAMIHDLELSQDSRSQKEICTLIKNGYNVIFCGWNKDLNSKNRSSREILFGYEVHTEEICIKVQRRAGILKNGLNLIKYEFKLFSWLLKNRKKYDIIHACNMDTAFAAVIIGKLIKKRVVYDIYDDYADSHVSSHTVYKIIKAIDQMVIKCSDYVIICSEKRKQQLAAIPKCLEVIHNAPNINDISLECYTIPKSDRIKVAYVGNLTDNRLIKELVHVCSGLENIELYIGGSGPLEKSIKEYDEKYTNIHFLGRLKYSDVISLENQCDIVPALYDPIHKNHLYAAPNKFYEALALGKPTIMVHNTGMDEIVDKEKTGLTIEYNENDLKKAIVQIAENIYDWRKSKKRLKALFEEKYSWNIMEEKLIGVYEALK